MAEPGTAAPVQVPVDDADSVDAGGDDDSGGDDDEAEPARDADVTEGFLESLLHADASATTTSRSAADVDRRDLLNAMSAMRDPR